MTTSLETFATARGTVLSAASVLAARETLNVGAWLRVTLLVIFLAHDAHSCEWVFHQLLNYNMPCG
jgi:hypothetical protein